MTTYLVTGATDGIGKETARVLAKKGRVLVHGRTAEKAARAAKEVLGEPVFGDLSSLKEIRALASQVEDVDVLVHNAGVFMTERVTTVDGYETTFAVNHLAPFLLTQLLLPRLRGKDDARIVVVSSNAHNGGHVDLSDLQMSRRYDGYRAYCTSKLMNILFTYELARREPSIACNALHPGVINTKLLRVGFGMGGATVESGARTSVKVASDPALRGVTGKYFSDERERASSSESHDRELQRALWEASAQMVG